MTKALRKAFEAASRLPDPDQDELAAAILEELEADERWEAAFAHSQDALARLADEALEEHRAGRTEPVLRLNSIGPTWRLSGTLGWQREVDQIKQRHWRGADV